MSERFSQEDIQYLEKAIELATRGRGYVSPNPMVGAVVVKDREIVGTGFHRRYGGDHAEVEALREAGHLAHDATLYCTLEPCSHYGKTPPCVERVIESGIRKVVLGSLDPNPLVNGKGIHKLRQSGIHVQSGLLADQCLALNEVYFKHITTGLPFVHLKVAQSLDGNIADKSGHSNWISNDQSRRLVHRWRWQNDAILIGIGTAIDDNPRLTIRLSQGKQPYRIVLDSHLRIPLHANLLSDDFVDRTIIVISDDCDETAKEGEITGRGASVWRVEPGATGGLNLRRVLERLGREKMASVLIEGGRRIFTSFLEEQLADRLTTFISPILLGEGIPAFQGLPISGISRSITLLSTKWRILGDNAVMTGNIDYPRVD